MKQTLDEKAKTYANQIQSRYDDEDLDTINLYHECRRAYLAGATEALDSKWHTKEEINGKMLEIGEKFLCYNADLEVYFLAIYRGLSHPFYGPGRGDHLPDLVPMWEIDDENYDHCEIDFWMKLPQPPKPADQ